MRGANWRRLPALRTWLPLPPRARGKLRQPPGADGRAASTPACAGQTEPLPSATTQPEPLPPRARGKLIHRGHGGPIFASTPACAGQTRRGGCSPPPCCLYPRVRGANPDGGVRMTPLIPLPPRARGKLLAVDVEEGEPPSTPACAGQTLGLDGGVGGYASTPACAGQTRRSSPSSPHLHLYPRVRGANEHFDMMTGFTDPLPPRARGKLCG